MKAATENPEGKGISKLAQKKSHGTAFGSLLAASEVSTITFCKICQLSKIS